MVYWKFIIFPIFIRSTNDKVWDVLGEAWVIWPRVTSPRLWPTGGLVPPDWRSLRSGSGFSGLSLAWGEQSPMVELQSCPQVNSSHLAPQTILAALPALSGTSGPVGRGARDMVAVSGWLHRSAHFPCWQSLVGCSDLPRSGWGGCGGLPSVALLSSSNSFSQPQGWKTKRKKFNTKPDLKKA